MNNKLVIYYSILLVLLVLWNNPNALPPFPARLGFLLLVVIPLLVQVRELFYVVLMFFVILSGANHAISYMPTTGPFVLATVVISATLFRRSDTKRLKLPVGLFLLLILTTIMDLGTSLRIYQVSYSFLIIVIVSLCCISNNPEGQIDAMKLSFIILSLILSVEYYIWGEQFATQITVGDEEYERLGWADPNYFSCVIGFGALVAYSQLLFSPSKIRSSMKWLYFFTILLSLSVIILTASRGATIAILSAMILSTLFSRVSIGRKILILIIGTLALVLLFYIGSLDLLYGRFEADDGTAGDRTVIWSTKLNAFSQSNLFHQLFGYGSLKGRLLGYSKIQGFHNDYLAFLVCYGFTGVILFLSILLFPIIHSQKARCYTIPYMAYMAMVSMSLEPFFQGSYIYMYFYLYILLLKQQVNNNNTLIDEAIQC